MERLTTHDPSRQLLVCSANYKLWNEIYDRLAYYEDTGLEPEEIKEQIGWLSPVCFGCEGRKPDFSRSEKCGYERDEFRLCLGRSKHLVDLVKAEQEGRLVVLPCKVGDTVYQKDHCGNIYEAIVQSVVIDKRRTIFNTSGIGFDETAVGKTVFLSLEEAEKALEGVSEDD